MTRPIFVVAGGDGRADRQRGVGPEVRERDDDPGRAGRLDVDPDAVDLPVDDVVGDGDHAAVDGGVDVGVDRRAHVEAAGLGADAAFEHVVADVGAARAEEPAEEPLGEARVRLRPDRLERERQRAARVVAERGHAALVDGKLDPQGVLRGDDLRPRRAGRQEARGRRRAGDRHGRLAAAPEGGEEERDEAPAGDDDERRGAARSTGFRPGFLTLALPRARGEARGFRRSHPRHGNEGGQCFQTERALFPGGPGSSSGSTGSGWSASAPWVGNSQSSSTPQRSTTFPRLAGASCSWS